MEKKWIIAIIILALVGAGVAYYLISPVWRVVELQEESPLAVKDMMDKMSPEEKEQFEKAVEEVSNNIVEMKEDMPASPQLLTEGPFLPRAHEVMGKALLIQDGDKKILRFEDFETINGPSLHIYLASSLGEEDYVDLGPIKGTKGNINYELPANVDTDKYNKVLVWCVPFRVLFSYAELK